MTRLSLLLVTGMMPVLLIAGAATGFYLHRDEHVIGRDVSTAEADVAEDADDVVRQAQPLYFTFTTPFTVNVKGSDTIIQASVAVSTHYATTIENVKDDEPALRAAVVMTLSNVPETTAATDAGKQQMERQLTVALNNQLRADRLAADIDQAYFSDFLIDNNDDDN